MFSTRVCAVALSFFAVAQATLVITNVTVIGNSTSSITFSSSDADTDPTTVSVELTNPAFNDKFAVGTNVEVANGKFNFETPQLLPGPGYSIQLVNIFNDSDILAQSPTFTVVENDVKSSSTTSGSSTVSSGALSSPTANSATFTTPSSSQTGAAASSTQSGLSSNTGSPSSSAPPSSSSNTVFGGNNNSGATGLQASLALGLVGVAFAFL